MRDYSKISGQFWTGRTGRALRGDQTAQIVALYLMTCAHANMIGVFHCPLIYIAHESGCSIEGASKGLLRLCEEGFCTFDEDSETVWVHEMAKFQIGDELVSSDKRVKGIQKQFDNLPDGLIKRGFHEKYCKAYHLPKMALSDSPLQAPSKPLRSQKQEQKQKQEQEQDPSPPSEPPQNVDNSTPAGLVCRRLRALGVEGVNPHNPNLLRLIKAGVTADEFAETAREPKARGKGFAWLLATVEGRRNDASAKGDVAAKYEAPWFLSASGIQTKGDELGIKQKDGEMFPYFRKRVFEASGVTDEVIRKAKIDAGEKV